jgi:hypothetical protein
VWLEKTTPSPTLFPLSKIIYKHNIIRLEAGLDFGGSGIYCGVGASSVDGGRGFVAAAGACADAA